MLGPAMSKTAPIFMDGFNPTHTDDKFGDAGSDFALLKPFFFVFRRVFFSWDLKKIFLGELLLYLVLIIDEIYIIKYYKS